MIAFIASRTAGTSIAPSPAIVPRDWSPAVRCRSKLQQRFYRTNLSISGSAMMYSLTFPDGDHWHEASSPSMMTTVAV
jgi:hypothetical protein